MGGGPAVSTADSVTTETVASGLSVPWALVFAPDGRLFFTEQPGRIRVMINGQVQSQPVYDKTAIVPGGESGMLGLALDPAFGANRRMYVFYCFNAPERVRCRIERLLENNNAATFDKVLWEGDSGEHHPAGRLKFGPDGLLYAGYGDIFRRELAQDLSSDAGSILRMDTDGNPRGTGFASAYALVKGLRDPQGLAFDSAGNLYISEHGPDSNDEINLIVPGRNYGWSLCIGVCNNPAWVDPIRLWTPETAAPSGATFYNSTVIPAWNGSMLIALLGLSGNDYARHLHRIKFDAPGGTRILEEEALFRGEFGRLRDVVQGPDGFVYFSTSNGGGADRIIRVRPR
ncbi:MAG TPA: PQQ-dependent sugar dehydrogenase [Clostridia bacterium]|nr:PQQ-dependent sugar dehydrogenase [Clostridia bacterium]